MQKEFFVYILECSNNSYYCGYTDDLEKRWQKHISGKGSKYTRAFKPKKIVASWKLKDKSTAMSLEAKIKKLPRKEKTRLVTKALSIKNLLS